MSLTRQLAHNTIAQIFGKIVSTLLGLVAVAMMTRYLGAEQFGWYITAISFLQFAGILIDFGLIPVSAQMLSEDRFEKKELFHNLLSFRFVSALICLTLVPFIALFFPYPFEVKIAIIFSAVSALGISMNQILTGFFQTELKMHLQSLGELLGRLVLVGGLALLIWQGASFLSIMLLITLATLSYMGTMLVFTRKYISLRFKYNPIIWRAIVTKMWPITLSIVFNVIYLKGDIILLSLYRSQEEVGLYGAAYRVIDILTQIAMLTMGLLLPLLSHAWAKKETEKFKEHYERAIFMMMLIGLPLTTGTFLLAGPIMRLVAGTEFIHAGRPLQILSLAVFGLFLGAIYGHMSVAINRQKSTLPIYIFTALFTLIGYLIFIPRFGMIGAAWMSVISELFVGVSLVFLVHHWTKVTLSNKWILIKILFSTIIMAMSIFFMKNLNIFIVISVSGIVYFLALVLTRTLRKETLKEILSFH